MGNTKGSVLIISLIFMSIATAIALFIIKLSKDTVASYQMIVDKLQAKIQAESEIERLIYILLTSNFNKYKVEITKNFDIYPSEVILDGTPFSLGNDTIISLIDLSSRVNLLVYSDETSLKNVLSVILGKKLATKLTDSYLDWIDQDSFTRLSGAEDSYYREVLKAKYTPRNNNFLQSLEELTDIRYVDNDVYNKLKEYCTINYLGGTLNLFLADISLIDSIQYVDKLILEEIKNFKKKKNYKALHKYISQNQTLSEIFTLEPSRVLKISLTSKRGEAVEKIYCIIDFKETEKQPYTIYKYKE